MTEVDEYAKAQEAEYGTYVAKDAISIDGVRAFNPGHAVPKSHVDRGLVDASQVVKVGTKAAETVAAQVAADVNSPKAV